MMAEYIDREAIRYEQEIRYASTIDLTELTAVSAPIRYCSILQ